MKLTRLAAAAGAAVVLTLAAGAPAMATHSHYIDTPGTCVDKAGAGFGTGQEHGEGIEAPSFHTQVHKGTPGLFAFEREHNPIFIVGFAVCP